MDSPDIQPPDYWADIFPFDPYTNQVEGINESINTLGKGGIHLLEGPCGTGKTLIALTAGLALVRDPNTKFKRVLVITSKKQQLSAFEDDLQAINSRSDTYFRGLSLVGKSDLCPYVQADKIDPSNIYQRCIGLRDNTHQLMAEAVKQKKTEREANAAFGLEMRAKRDPSVEETLSVEGTNVPYQPTIPELRNTEYCPFYASHITNSVQDEFPLNLRRVTTAQETLLEGSKAGTCPHLEMRRLHDQANVLFGNYKHTFDPTTVGSLTGGVIGDTTLLIADEAHGIVQEVRNQLSYQISYSTLKRGIVDINEVKRWITGNGERQKCRLADSILSATDLNRTDLPVAVKFLEHICDVVATEIADHLKDEYGEQWKRACHAQWDDEITIPLQDPSKEDPDSITTWVSKQGYDNIWETFLKVSKVVSVTKDVIAREVDGKSPDGAFPISNVHELLERWWVGNHIEYYREIALDPRTKTQSDPPLSEQWKSGYTATLKINNCLPQNEIAGTLDAFGGALLMSATLSPLKIYEEVTGVNKLRHGTQPSDSLVTMALPNADPEAEDEHKEQVQPEEEAPDLDAIGPTDDDPATPAEERRRQVGRSVFQLGFPEENRLSVAVDVPRFTYSNRWPPGDNQQLRTTYRNIITAVVKTTPGNVLITMPSYLEASWASEVLTENPEVTKDVLTDTSSSDTATEQLKEAFFDGPAKVLTTSLRGTLTEGVDFDGSKLRGVVVCGVPITNTATNLASAIETAYDDRFDNSGFEYAFSIPAVRKARQALGRVIRGSDDIGVRVLADERYVRSNRSGVRKHFPDYQQHEFISVTPRELAPRLGAFWEARKR